MSIAELSEQEQIRRNSLAQLRELGIDPYPAARYEVTATAAQIAAEYSPEKQNFSDISIAGRILSRRIMGSASFFELQDHTGKIQVYIKRDEVCGDDPEATLYNKVFKKLLDIGDIVGVRGFAFVTKTGELSVHCKESETAEQVAAAAADRQGERRQSVRRVQRSRAALPPALRRSDRQSAGASGIPAAHEDHRHDAPLFQRTGLRRGRNADPAVDSRRSVGPPVRHASQCARHSALPADRQRVVPQEADRRRVRRRIRVRQGLPQRGHGPHAQSRVHGHGNIRRLQGLHLDDGVRRADARTGGTGAARHDESAHRRAHGRFRRPVPPRDDDRRDPREDRLRHHRQKRTGTARSLRQAERRDRRDHGQGQADRRDFRRLLRAGSDPADVRHGLPDRDVAAVQAPPQQSRPDRAVRAVRDRQGAVQRLFRV